MPGISKEGKDKIAVYKRLEFLEGKSQAEITEYVVTMPFENRGQLRDDINKIDFYSPASLYDIVPLVKTAFLYAPRYCPDCQLEWDNHHPLCPRYGKGIESL